MLLTAMMRIGPALTAFLYVAEKDVPPQLRHRQTMTDTCKGVVLKRQVSNNSVPNDEID